MNTKIIIASTCLLVSAAASAQEPATLPAVQAQGVLQVFDCGARALPSQRQVGEWTGQHNFSQVYDTRQRLMADIGRACRRDGIERVLLVAEFAPAAVGGRRSVRIAPDMTRRIALATTTR